MDVDRDGSEIPFRLVRLGRLRRQYLELVGIGIEFAQRDGAADVPHRGPVRCRVVLAQKIERRPECDCVDIVEQRIEREKLKRQAGASLRDESMHLVEPWVCGL